MSAEQEMTLDEALAALAREREQNEFLRRKIRLLRYEFEPPPVELWVRTPITPILSNSEELGRG